MDRDQEHEKQEGSKPTADAKLQEESMCDGVSPVTTKETANTSGESVSGIESVTGHYSTQSEKSTDETQNKRGSLSDDSNSLKTGKPAKDTTSNNEREKKSDECNTGTASKDERESQSSHDEVLKNGEGTADTTLTNERENNSGDSEKQTPETVSKGMKKPDDDSSTTFKGDSPKDPSQTPDCNDIQKGYENIKKDYAEMERKFKSVSKEKEDLLVTKNTVKKERNETIQASKDLAEKDIDNQKTILDLKTNLSDIQKRISPSDVGNSTISKDNLPKASPDAAKIKKPDDDSSTTLKGDSPNDPSQASEHSDMDKPEVSYNQKRLTNDDRKEDKRQEETVEDQHRQSLERNEQLLKSCNDIQKEYENIKKDYAEMERKFESISKEKEDLLVTNNTFEKERKETIRAFKELAKKDIDNQKTISHLKTDLSDIKKRYNEMTKHLKEELKSWTQEKRNLLKEHNDESKKHKEEIDKADKAIGSLNQKVADKEDELQKKKNFMEKLIREKKEVDDKNAKHEKYMEKLKEHIKKLTEQKIKDESEHNKKVKDLNRVIHAERDNFSGLSYQYNELVKQIQSLQEENRSLTREKQELLLRLSKVAGANLTYNNPNIADLSDEKRPTKLAEEFSELYDNEWTDAFEDLQIENEKEKTTFMLELVMNACQLCSDISSDHGQKIKDSLCTLVLPSKPSKCSKECTDEDIIPATIAPLEETNSSTPKQVVIVEDKEIEDSKQKAGNLQRTSENTFGSGKTKENVQETTENTENKKEKTADDTKQSPSIKDRENKDNKDVETADDTNQSPSNKEQETTENIEGTTADGTKQSPPKIEVENKRDKEKKTADDVNNPSTESEQDTKENTENNEGEKARKTDTKQPPLINDGDDKENEEKETADDTKIPPSGNERGENTENKMVETTDDTKKPPSINEEDNKIYKEEKTADDANNALSVNEQENIENTEQAKKDTADVTYKPPSESKQDTTENTGNNEGGTAEKADTEQPASEDFVGRYDSDGPEQKKEHLSFTSKNTNGDVNGPGKAEQVDVVGDEDKENPEKPGKKQMLTSENTNGDEFDPHMTKVNERKTKEKEENEEEEIKATSSKHTLQGDIVGDDNKERVEKQDEKHMLLTSENTNGIEFDPNNEGLSQPENEVVDSGLLSQEQGSMNTNDKEDDASHANKQGDAVIPGADNTPEAKAPEAGVVKDIGVVEAVKNDPQSENRVQATDDKSKDITKEEKTATCSAKVDDTPEAKASYKHMESEANVVKETEKEEAVKKIRLESNFEKLLQKEQKKIIMDAKKLVEQHLSEEIEKAGTDLIVQENGIDTEKQESVVNYIKKCVNICWSMHRNEPPVFVEFPDITENVVFDTNKFKPYTKSGKYIDYIVWPAVYLHEGGPLLCKGVAQGRK